MRHGKLPGLVRQAKREGWADWIRSEMDERAVLAGMWFSVDAAEHVCDFCEHYIHFTQGENYGQKLQLIPWTRDDFLKPLFGWQKIDEKGRIVRRFKRGFLFIPKKNTKTYLCSMLALYLLCADGEMASEVYSAASDKKQAGYVFKNMARFVNASKELSKELSIIKSTRRITYETGGDSFFDVLPADEGRVEGLDSQGLIFDELHNQKKRDFFDSLYYAGIARRQPLHVYITTAGYDQNSICYEVYAYAKDVLKGAIEDLSFFGLIFEADEKDDWEDPATWRKANPSIGISFLESEMAEAAAKAKRVPAQRNAFLRYRLNRWTNQADLAIDLDLWDAQGGEVIEEDLIGRTGHGGLDLASTQDLTAWCMLFVDEEDEDLVRVLIRIWCPESRLTADDNRYRDSYRVWAEQGHLITTPGDAVDYEIIHEQVKEDCRRFGICDIRVDKMFQGISVCQKLEADLQGSTEVAGMSCNRSTMTAPWNDFERRLLKKKIIHGGQPCLRWNASNLALKVDDQDRKLPVKVNTQKKIDGMVALLLAMDGVMCGSSGVGSVYDTREMATA